MEYELVVVPDAEFNIKARLDNIKDWLYSTDKNWKLTNKKDEEFLLQLLKDYEPNHEFFSEAAYLISKYFKKAHIPALRDALSRIVKAKEWDVSFQVMIALDNVGENPFLSERKKGETGFGVQEDAKNRRMANAYLKRVCYGTKTVRKKSTKT